jgi:acetylornithine/succinyldiaminopimelate/putrescine aminotransferase
VSSNGDHAPTLPITAAEALAGLPHARTRQLELDHGNRDLVRVLDALGIAGPFKRIDPWELEDPRGRRLIHAGGYAALPFGERPDFLVDALRTALDDPQWVSFSQQGLSSLRAALEANLVALLHGVSGDHADAGVVFSNSGAEAVEVAIKMARTARPKSPWIITFQGGYHGKTMGALSVTPSREYQKAFGPLLANVRVLPYGDPGALAREVAAIGADQVAAVIAEPLQGEGGVVAPDPDFLPALEQLRERHGIVVIADEIQTGLGRTGSWFASVAGGLSPDIVTLAKPLSGGLIPVGATIARQDIVKRFLPGFSARRHSSTFAGNALAMLTGLHALEKMVAQDLPARAAAEGQVGLKRLQALAERQPKLIREVRGHGLLMAIVLHNPVPPTVLGGNETLTRMLASGLGVRGLQESGVHAIVSLTANGVVRLTPALNTPDDRLEQLWDGVDRFGERYGTATALARHLTPARLVELARLAARTP